MKYFVIPDIHSRNDLLVKLINKLDLKSYKKDKFTLIFLGDYLDRGKGAFQTIETLINLSKKYNTIFLKGNHEQLLFNWQNPNFYKEDFFFMNGGKETSISYSEQGYDLQSNNIPEEHKIFFSNLKQYHLTKDYFFSHAGIPCNFDYKLLEGVEEPFSENLENILTWSINNFTTGLSNEGKYQNNKFVCAGHHTIYHILTSLKNRFNKRILQEKKTKTEIEEHLLYLFEKYKKNKIKELPKEAYLEPIIGDKFALLDLGTNITNNLGCLILPEKEYINV